MRGSPSHFDQPVKRSRLGSWWSAGSAVDGDISQEDYLRGRLRHDEARYRRSDYPLPSTVSIGQGKIEKIPNPDYDPSWEQIRDDPTDEQTSELFQSQSALEEITREEQELEEEDAWLKAKELSIREQQDALEEEEIDGIGTGKIAGPTTTRRRKKNRGRRRPPFPWLPVLGYTAIVLLTLIESYQLALPFLDMIGVDTTRLGSEWRVNPLGVLGGAGFAIAASVSLFFLWYLILRIGSAFSRSLDSAAPARLVCQGAGLLFLCVFLLGGTYVIANLRHGMTTDLTALLGEKTDINHSVFLFLALIVPFTSACLHHRIGQSACWQARRDSIAANKQWEREAEERLLPAETLTDRMHRILGRRAEIEKQRTHLRTKHNSVVKRAQAVQHHRLTRLAQAKASTQVYAETLLAALEQDRQYFLRAANKKKALHLLSSQPRRPSPPPPPPWPFIRGLLSTTSNGHRS